MTGALVMLVWLAAVRLWLPLIRDVRRAFVMPGGTGDARQELPRRAMHGRLSVEIDWARQSGEGLAVICFRIYGPDREAAIARLHAARRAHETVIRWDERTVLLAAWNVDELGARQAARRLAGTMRATCVGVAIDVAIALVGRDGASADELLAALDEDNLRAIEELVEPAIAMAAPVAA